MHVQYSLFFGLVHTKKQHACINLREPIATNWHWYCCSIPYVYFIPYAYGMYHKCTAYYMCVYSRCTACMENTVQWLANKYVRGTYPIGSIHFTNNICVCMHHIHTCNTSIIVNESMYILGYNAVTVHNII